MSDRKDDLKGKVIKLFGDNAKPKSKDAKRSIKQAATGNGNIQVAGDIVNVTLAASRKVVVKREYVPGTIGSIPTLKDRIESMINELGLRRERRVGANAYAVVGSMLKKDFGIPKNTKWTSIWDWHESRAAELIDYLEAKLGNTIEGRIQRASQKPGYKLTRGQLFKVEKHYCDLLGCAPDSTDVKELRKQMFGTTSRKDLNDNQFRNWVEHLKSLVVKVHGPDF
jgi:hypothetical protein